MLTFDEATHRYTWNGQPVQNVTGILAPLMDFSMIPPAVLERARQEGKATHKMVELDCLGTLDVAGLPEWMKPVYKAWCDFKAASGYQLILSEWKGYNLANGVAGTLDQLCELPHLKGWKGVALLDVKRSLFGGPMIGLQTAAYKAMVESDKGMPKVSRRGALRIGNDGKFKLEPYDDPADYSNFLALLNTTRFCAKHRLALSLNFKD